jgi:DNA-binding transcriptional ArsR family regulator
MDSQRCAVYLRALSEPIRLRILDALRGGPLCVTDLAEQLDVEIVTVSHHLKILSHASLLEQERRGRFIYYRLHPDVYEPATSSRKRDRLDFGCCKLELQVLEPVSR